MHSSHSVADTDGGYTSGSSGSAEEAEREAESGAGREVGSHIDVGKSRLRFPTEPKYQGHHSILAWLDRCVERKLETSPYPIEGQAKGRKVSRQVCIAPAANEHCGNPVPKAVGMPIASSVV